jgi:hypothetical protein
MKKMAGAAVFPVEVSRIAAVHAMHHLQQIALRCFKHQMIVIFHKYETMDAYVVAMMIIG